MWRDARVLLLLTAGAMVLLVLMAYTFSLDIEAVPTAVLDYDGSRQSRAYLDALANDRFFDIRFQLEHIDQIQRYVEDGRVKVAIVVPVDFSANLARGEEVAVQVIVDGSYPNTASQAVGHITALSQNFTLGLWQEALAQNGLDVRTRVRYNPDLKTIHGIVPGLMSIVLALPALSAALALAREKETGSIEGLMVTPLTRLELLVGKLTPYVLLGLFDVLSFTLIGTVGFGVPLRGGLPNLLLFSSVFLAANLGIGLLVATLVNSQQAALTITFLVFTAPPWILSGLFFPVESMPRWLQYVAFAIPATHFVTIARGIFLKGIGVETLWASGMILLVFGLVFNVLAVSRIRMKLATDEHTTFRPESGCRRSGALCDVLANMASFSKGNSPVNP